MGSSQHSSKLADYIVEEVRGNLSVLSRRISGERLLMKSYVAPSKEELVGKLRYFKEYRSNMEGNQEVTRIVQIVQEKDQHFCSTSHRLHLVFEHSPHTIAQEIRQRRDSKHKENPPKYFNYQDLCNILYSGLSALWFSQQLMPGCPDYQLARFGTAFLSTHQMLIFGQGVLKIMDPFVSDFHSRHIYQENTYYSPEKLQDFGMVDDVKCAIFELGMAMLEIALLEPLSEAYCGHEYREEVTTKKLERARQIYSSDVENSLTVSVFDLVEKMVEADREERFTLQEAIAYAEQMYEVQESFAQTVSPSHPTHFRPPSNSQKPSSSQHRTTNTTPKQNSAGKFYDFRNSTLCDRDDESMGVSLRSPRITNFTIHEVEPERQEQSSMLQSPTINNAQEGAISESVVQGGIFSTINIADSYNYGLHPRLNSTLKEERIFTDPELLRTIHRELRQIEERKKHRRDDIRGESRVVERRERFESREIDSAFKITNAAYLR